MKFTNIKEVNEFLSVVDSCEGSVTLTSPYGDRFNLKSKLTQYVSLAKIFSNGEMKNEIELICYNPEDINNLFEYMIG